MTGQTTLRVFVSPGILRGVGLADIVEQVTPPSTSYSASNLPYTLGSGETLRDNIPAGVPIYEATTYSSSTDIYTILAAVESAVSAGGYVHLPAGTYHINTLRLVTTNEWQGYNNGYKKVMGLIGDGADQTFIKTGSAMIPSDARAYALSPTDTTSPVPLWCLYFSNTNSSVPLFFSGITFDGSFQGPYGVPASSGLSVNTSTASPIPYRGLALWHTVAGSRVQFCRFRGFGFALKAAPPYELSGIESNYDNGLVIARTEVDGRLPTGEVSAGGIMPNYTYNLTIQDSWLHHTRRSGFAIHEHGLPKPSEAGTYVMDNFQVENINNTADSFAGSSLNQFMASNVEQTDGNLTYRNCRFDLFAGCHIDMVNSYGTDIPQSVNVADFTSLSTAFNGCVVIRVLKTPNSTGTSPLWTLMNTSGIGALPFFVTKAGNRLTGVATTSFNASVHTPDKYFMVVTS